MITHPEKLLFPDDGISKGDLARYYESVAPVMVPHLRGRPVTLERYPSGIGAKGFIQKNLTKGFPPWIQRVDVPKKSGSVSHLLIDDLESLLWATNQNCITPHVWPSRVPALYQPDLCVFDLDPSRDDPAELRAAALAVRAVLEELELPTWVKTSGSKGFHIVVPLDGEADFETASRFAHGVGALLVKRHPHALTQEFIKADRGARILVDTGRNRYSATFAAAYAVRAKPGAPVSAPCTWNEIERGSVGPRSFTLHTLRERVDRLGDVWAELHARPASLNAAHRRLATLLSEDEWRAGEASLRRKSVPKVRR